MRHFLISVAVLISSLPLCCQTMEGIQHLGPFSVGYQNLIRTDSSRVYKPGTRATEKLHLRPVEIDLWYPCSATHADSLLAYGHFLSLLEQRSNRFQDDTIYSGMTTALVKYIAANLNIPDAASLTRQKTNSYGSATPLQKKFPLIVYMTSFNGMCYENIRLFEQLSSHGYIVACISSVGRYPGNMSEKPVDLIEQVNDGIFAINALRNRDHVDSARIGIMGYSWGGLAALVLSMNKPGIKAVLSFDGSEMHYYGDSKEEDKDFDEIRNASFFHLRKTGLPYAYMESGFKQNDRIVDSIFNILALRSSPKYYIHFSKASHEDFSSLPGLKYQISKSKINGPDLNTLFNGFAISFFDQYLKDQGDMISSALTTIYTRHLGDSAYPAVDPLAKETRLIRGRVVDRLHREALVYVNIGIPEKNIGTVTGKDGAFTLSIQKALLKDSLKISIVGYQSKTYSIDEFLKTGQPTQIILEEKPAELKEVVISAKGMQTKIKGNTTKSDFVSVGLPLKFLGSETAIKINLGKDPVLLKLFRFNIAWNRLDTAVFRMNIYQFKNGVPAENILKENVLVPVGKQTGLYTLNLAPYRLIMKGEILLALEWIEGSSSGTEHGAIFLSAAFLNSATWHRLTSQGAWKKASGMGVGFNIEFQKLKD